MLLSRTFYVMPLIVCTAPRSLQLHENTAFWLKKNTFVEMPSVTFNHHVVTSALTSTGSRLQWSTDPKLNEFFGKDFRPFEVSVRFAFLLFAHRGYQSRRYFS